MSILLVLGIVYIVFSYLYMMGYVVSTIGGSVSNLCKVGWTILTLAPITLPIALGAARSQD